MNKYFKAAKRMADCSPSKFKVGAALVRGHNIISTGFNIMEKSNPHMKRYADGRHREFIGTHAEYACVGNMRNYDIGNKSKLYLFRTKKEEITMIETQGMAKPCDACVRMLLDKNINRIYFSLDDEGYGELILHGK